jgi:hypothetical protein
VIKMKKVIMFLTVIALLVAGLLLPVSAVSGETQRQSEGIFLTAASVLSLDGTWVILDEVMDEGDLFSGPWTWDSDLPVKFTITDLYVVTDRFKVYNGGSFVIETPNIPDWDVLGFAGPMVSPPYTVNPDVALADGRFSSALINFASGSHSIDIEDIHIPPVSVGGDPFIDGTVAFKAERLREWPIDIKPGSDPNSINLKSKGVVPVAVLTTDLFDAATVDPETVELEGVAALKWAMDDVDGDGDLDLVLHFSTQELAVPLDANSTEATLTGETNDGEAFSGTDSVRIVKA